MGGKNVQVAIKVRPLLQSKKEEQNLWKIVDNSIQLIDSNADRFYFDHIFDQDASNQTIFDTMAKHIVVSAIKGFNGTIFAYGQTSSGKTYTMMGDNRNPGVMVLAAKEIFKEIGKASDRQFLLRVGYIEIYNEKVKDLLDKKNQDLKIQDSGNGDVLVPCEEVIITSEESFLKHLISGNKQRKIGETNMNERSSRSHAIFRVIIESRKVDLSEDDSVQLSILNLVDLAGSERADQSGATGSRLKEGAHINKSLLFLSLVIKSLSENEPYINYRDSKLTRILQASLGGNALTAIICTIKPTVMEETLSTLSFAMRAKTVKNKPHVNESIKDATMMKRLEKEISRLQSELEEEKKKTESQIRITMLEKRLKDTYLKFVDTSSVLASQKTTGLRRRTWCPSSTTDDTDDSSIPCPVNSDNKFSLPIVLQKKTSQQLPKPICFYTPQIVMSRGDEFATSSNGPPNMNAIEEEFVPAEDVNFGEDLLTPVNSPRTSLNILPRGSTTPKLNIYQRAKQVEREFEELKIFTNLENQLNVDHDTFGMLKSKLEEAEKSVIRLQQERAEHVLVQEQCKEQENNLKHCRERCTELESKVTDYEDVISLLRTKLADLEKENQNAVSLEFEFKRIKTKSEIREKELLDALNEKEKIVSKLENSVQALTAKLQESYKETCSELKAEQETNAARNQLQTLQSEYHKMQEKCNEQNRTINTVQLDYKQIQIKYKNLLDKYDQLEANSILTTKEYTTLQAANDDLQNEIRKLKSSVEQTQTILLNSNSTNPANNSEEIPSLKATNQQLKEELHEVQMKFDKLQKEYEELSNQLVDGLQENEVIQLKYNRIADELSQLKKDKSNLSAKEVQTDVDDNWETKLSTPDYLAPNLLQTIELIKEIEIDLSSSTGKKQIFKTSSIDNESTLRRLLIQNISNIRIANSSEFDDMQPLMQGVINFKIIEECREEFDSLENAIESSSGSRQSCDSLETIEVTNKKTQDYLIEDDENDDEANQVVLQTIGQNIVKLVNNINEYEDADILLTIVDEIVCKIMEILSTVHTSDAKTDCHKLMHSCCEYSKLFNKLCVQLLPNLNEEKKKQFHDTSNSILVDNKIQEMNSFNVIIQNLKSQIEEKESLESQQKQQIEEWREKYNSLESKFHLHCENVDQNNEIQMELTGLREKYASLQKEFMENKMTILHLQLELKMSTALWKEKSTKLRTELQTKETCHASELRAVDNKYLSELSEKSEVIEKLEKQLLENNAKISELERKLEARNSVIATTDCQEGGDSTLIVELKENLADLQQQLESAKEENTTIDLLMKKTLEEKSNLEKKIQNLTKQSKESESLKKEKHDLQIECDKNQKEILNLKKSIDSLSKEKQDFEPAWQRLKAKNLHLQNAIEDLNESIEKHKTTCDDLKRENVRLQTAMNHLELEKQEQQEMCENLRRKFLDIEEMEVEKDLTNSDYDQMAKEKQMLEDERNALLLKNNEISKAKDILLSEKDSLKNENQKLQNLIKTYTEDMKVKEKSLNEFQEKYNKQVNENENLRINMENLKMKFDESTKEFSTEIANLHDVIKLYTENLKSLESKNSDLISKLESLSNDLKSAQSKISDYDKLLQKYMELKSQFDESTSAHETETESLKSQLKTIKKQLIEERSTLLKRAKEFENRFNELELRCKSMNANNSDLHKINETLQDNLQKAEKDAKRCQTLRSEIDSMKLELISREKSLTQLNMENQKISHSKLELRTKLEATIKEANMDIERCKYEILQLSETKLNLSEQMKRLQNTLHHKQSTFMAEKETLEKTIAELVADKKHLEEKMMRSLSKTQKFEQELNDIKTIHGASGGASPPKRRTVDLLVSENHQLKVKNNCLMEKLESSSHMKTAKNEERKNRRLSTHDERRRHSLIGSNHDVSTMTDATDVQTDLKCNCEVLESQLKDYERQTLILRSQVSKLGMDLKMNPLKAENAALKKRLQEEDDRQYSLRNEIKKYKQLVDKAQNSAAEAIALVDKKPEFTSIDVQTTIDSNDMVELMKLHGKNEDLKKICRSRLSRLKDVEKEVVEFEIYKKKYADLKILLQIRGEEIESLKKMLSEKTTS